MSWGLQYVSAVLSENSVSAFLKHGKVDHLFIGVEEDVFSFVKEYVKEYGSLPTPVLIEQHTGESLKPHEGTAQYYIDMMTMRWTEQSVLKAMKTSNDLLKAGVKDINGSVKVLADLVLEVSRRTNQIQISDFRDAYDSIIAAYADKLHASDHYGLRLGWPYLDEQTGGIVEGDLVSFVGKVMQGKTWMMLYAALFGWREAGLAKLAAELAGEAYELPNQSRLFISMEVNALQIKQRMASVVASIPYKQLKQGELSSVSIKGLKHSLTEIKGFGDPFWVVDGNLTANVEDIWMMVRQLKPAAVFVDGGYLLKHPTVTDRFVRVAENCDLLKTQICPLCPVVASWQFQTKSNQKKKGEQYGLDDIGYSKAIAELSSLAVGLFQEESVETIQSRILDLLKGRNGETGRWNANWNFSTMDFSQIVEKSAEDLQFL